jgi:hypothetical protein
MTMEATNTAPSAPTPAESGTQAASTFEQRFEALKSEAMREEAAGPSGSADAPSDAVSPPAETPKTAPADPADPAAAKRAEERRARLEQLKAETRAQVDAKAGRAEQDRIARELAEYKRRAEEAETRASKMLDPDAIDEAAWVALAERRNIRPERVAEWIRTSMEHPERVAEAAAIKATQQQLDPKLAALEARLAAAERRAAEAEDRQARALAEAQERQQTQQFLGMVRENAERSPLAAKLLATDEHEFLMMAEIAAASVPGMGPQALLDAVEELLDGEGRKAAQTYAALYGIGTSQAPVSKPTTSRGAVQPKTVSNSSARERATIVDDDGFAGLSFDERLARLKSMR